MGHPSIGLQGIVHHLAWQLWVEPALNLHLEVGALLLHQLEGEGEEVEGLLRHLLVDLVVGSLVVHGLEAQVADLCCFLMAILCACLMQVIHVQVVVCSGETGGVSLAVVVMEFLGVEAAWMLSEQLFSFCLQMHSGRNDHTIHSGQPLPLLSPVQTLQVLQV